MLNDKKCLPHVWFPTFPSMYLQSLRPAAVKWHSNYKRFCQLGTKSGRRGEMIFIIGNWISKDKITDTIYKRTCRKLLVLGSIGSGCNKDLRYREGYLWHPFPKWRSSISSIHRSQTRNVIISLKICVVLDLEGLSRHKCMSNLLHVCNILPAHTKFSDFS